MAADSDPLDPNSFPLIDSDGDGVEDIADLFPQDASVPPIIDSDLTKATFPAGVIELSLSAVEDPSVVWNAVSRAFLLSSDNTYRTPDKGESLEGPFQRVDYSTPTQGSFESLQGGYVLQAEPQYLTVSVVSPDELVNVNPDVFLEQGVGLAVRLETKVRMGVIEQGSDSWRVAFKRVRRVYQDYDSEIYYDDITVDSSEPVYTESSAVEYFEIVKPSPDVVPFTAVELIGDIAIPGINDDNTQEIEHCTPGAGLRIDHCADIVRFNANNTAYTLQGERSAVWSLDNGTLELEFADTGTTVTLTRLYQDDDTSSVLSFFETSDEYKANVEQIFRADAPKPESIDNFYGVFLRNAYGVTAGNDRVSPADGNVIPSFGFIINEDGTAIRHQFYELVDRGLIIEINDRTWSIEDGVLTSIECRSHKIVDGEQVCDYLRTRIWELLKETEDRIYVYETIRMEYGLLEDGSYDRVGEISRPNFYERADYVDVYDIDRDGYANEEDAFPLDGAEWVDTDGDGIGNNADTDDDNDGYSDADESLAGTDPLDANSYPTETSAEAEGLPIWMLYLASQLASDDDEQNPPEDEEESLEPPSVGKCDEDIFGRVDCDELSSLSLPYSSSGSQTISQLPRPAYFTFGTFVITAELGSYRASELVAEDSNGAVSPEIHNLVEGQILTQGETVTIELRTPPTQGQQARLRYFISFEGESGEACNDCTFTLERVFTSN